MQADPPCDESSVADRFSVGGLGVGAFLGDDVIIVGLFSGVLLLSL